MERRTMRGRLLLGLAASVCAALVIFVGVPWLAAPGPATVEASQAPKVEPPPSVVESTHAAPVGAPAGIEATPASASGSRWSEFEVPLGVDGSAPAVETAAAKPSPGVPMSAAHPAGQAGPLPPGLPPRPAASRPEAALVPHTLRGAMGYRLPLVSRQQVPDQVVSGILIPAHATYVILQPGYWELVGLTLDEVNVLRAAAEKTKADEPAVQSEPPSRGWNPLRLFRKNKTATSGK